LWYQPCKGCNEILLPWRWFSAISRRLRSMVFEIAVWAWKPEQSDSFWIRSALFCPCWHCLVGRPAVKEGNFCRAPQYRTLSFSQLPYSPFPCGCRWFGFFRPGSSRRYLRLRQSWYSCFSILWSFGLSSPSLPDASSSFDVHDGMGVQAAQQVFVFNVFIHTRRGRAQAKSVPSHWTFFNVICVLDMG